MTLEQSYNMSQVLQKNVSLTPCTASNMLIGFGERTRISIRTYPALVKEPCVKMVIQIKKEMQDYLSIFRQRLEKSMFAGRD